MLKLHTSNRLETLAESEVLARNVAFYEAFNARDMDAMDDLWAQSAPCSCAGTVTWLSDNPSKLWCSTPSTRSSMPACRSTLCVWEGRLLS